MFQEEHCTAERALTGLVSLTSDAQSKGRKRILYSWMTSERHHFATFHFTMCLRSYKKTMSVPRGILEDIHKNYTINLD